ncbi:MAG TPA: glycosyltransferase family 2 protein [Bacteroidales bacterium]|nr:glycosyltransferase family 2 protein [Bacteroidales bacterium]
MDLSIIIPVFNAEKFIVRCLDSIFNQAFPGLFEVIAVDDASTDKSLELLRDYQKNEKGLKIVEHKINKKESIARASGMNVSTGDYIMHVDADDWILPGALENLLNKIRKDETDVLVFDVTRVSSDGSTTKVNLIKKEFRTRNKIKVHNLFFGSSVNKIVRRSLTRDLISGKIENINVTADFLYAVEILLRAETISTTREIYYAYFINRESVTWTLPTSKYLDSQCIVLQQFHRIVQFYKADKKFVVNALKYLEKHILRQILKLQFIKGESYTKMDLLIDNLSRFSELSPWKIKSFTHLYDSKAFLLAYSVLVLGLRDPLSVLFRSIKEASGEKIRTSEK